MWSRREFWVLGCVTGWPGMAAADSLAWDDGRLALPVFLAGAGLMAIAGRSFLRSRSVAGALWWFGVLVPTGVYAAFGQAEAFQDPWLAILYTVGLAVFAWRAELALQRLGGGAAPGDNGPKGAV